MRGGGWRNTKEKGAGENLGSSREELEPKEGVDEDEDEPNQLIPRACVSVRVRECVPIRHLTRIYAHQAPRCHGKGRWISEFVFAYFYVRVCGVRGGWGGGSGGSGLGTRLLRKRRIVEEEE